MRVMQTLADATNTIAEGEVLYSTVMMRMWMPPTACA
jgi:hypothetical protein